MTTSQLDTKITAAILGNVGTLINFRLGADDAAVLAPEFAPEFSALDLETLGAYQICLKLAVNGLTSRPFSARTFSSLFPPVSAHQRDIILRVSREKYGIQRSRIESKINRWLAHSPTQGHESARNRSL